MICNEVKELLSEYIDNELEEQQAAQVKEHIASCEECKGLLKELVEIKKVLSDGGETAPDTLEPSVMYALKKEKHHGFRFKKRYFAIAAVLALAVVSYPLIGSLMNSKTSYDMAVESPSSPEAPAYDNSGGMSSDGDYKAVEESSDTADASSEQSTQRVQILNFYTSLEVTDIEQVFSDVKSIAALYGGYVESSNLGDDYIAYYNKLGRDTKMRNGYLQLRIPKDSIEKAIADVEKLGKVLKTGNGSSDITQYYSDLNTELENYKATRERMLDLLTKTGTLSETLEVERELSRLQYEINRLESTLKNTQNQVDYSYYSVQLVEVEGIESGLLPVGENFFTRIKEGLISSTNSILKFSVSAIVFIISIIPVLVVLAILYFVLRKPVVKLIRRFRK